MHILNQRTNGDKIYNNKNNQISTSSIELRLGLTKIYQALIRVIIFYPMTVCPNTHIYIYTSKKRNVTLLQHHFKICLCVV